MVELMGSHNGPESQVMPHLTYKYIMNEPFVGGDSAKIQDSHEQIKFKKQTIYELEPEKKVKTLMMEKEEMVEAFAEQFADNRPDINSLLIKQDREELFGLEIVESCNQTQLFEFDIEEFICFVEFSQLAKLPPDCVVLWGHTEWLDFIARTCILKLDIVKTENEKRWRQLANI